MSTLTIGRGLSCRRKQIISRAVRRRSLRARAADLPDSLTVHARFACHRWHAVCGIVRVNDYGTCVAATYAAAQEAFARRLGEGVPLRCITLTATATQGTFEARFNVEEMT